MSREYEHIANRMRERRNELGMSLQDLAKKTGMNKSTLQRYETGGIKNIPLDRLKSLSTALEMTPNQLIDYEYIFGDRAEKLYDQYIDMKNEGKTVGSMTVHEATLLDAYRKSDDQTKEMAERILFYNNKIGGDQK